MPCSILTLHAYRTWSPDHPRGYVKHGDILPPDPDMARRYAAAAKDKPVIFTPSMLELLHSSAIDITQRRKWRLHAVYGEPTHVHFVVSWPHNTASPEKLKKTFANVLSLFLGEFTGQPGKRWFVRRPSCRPVRNRAHFDHLLQTYRLKHRAVAWREGEPGPRPLGVLLPGRA